MLNNYFTEIKALPSGYDPLSKEIILAIRKISKLLTSEGVIKYMHDEMPAISEMLPGKDVSFISYDTETVVGDDGRIQLFELGAIAYDSKVKEKGDGIHIKLDPEKATYEARAEERAIIKKLPEFKDESLKREFVRFYQRNRFNDIRLNQYIKTILADREIEYEDESVIDSIRNYVKLYSMSRGFSKFNKLEYLDKRKNATYKVKVVKSDIAIIDEFIKFVKANSTGKKKPLLFGQNIKKADNAWIKEILDFRSSKGGYTPGIKRWAKRLKPEFNKFDSADTMDLFRKIIKTKKYTPMAMEIYNMIKDETGDDVKILKQIGSHNNRLGVAPIAKTFLGVREDHSAIEDITLTMELVRIFASISRFIYELRMISEGKNSPYSHLIPDQLKQLVKDVDFKNKYRKP